jgi:signal transduction histidine kinase
LLTLIANLSTAANTVQPNNEKLKMTFAEVFKFGKERETAFQKFFYKQDLIICRAATLLVITIMLVLGVIDYFRILDISWVLVARMIVCAVLTILLFITFQKKVSAAQLQLWLVFINVVMITSFYFMDAMAVMPPFYLPNSLVVYLFISSTVSGIRFRYSSSINFLVVLFFFFYFPTSIHADFHKSQIPNIVISFFLSLLISYMWEWYKRVNFLQQTQMNSLINIFSHDMVSPLNSLLGLLSLQHDNLLKKEEFDKHVESIKQATSNNILLLQNLVKWSKSQMDGFKPKLEPVNLSESIQEAVDLFQHLAHEKNIQINYPLTEELKCLADVEMAKLILRNTLSNAIKYSYPNSTIEIESKKETDQVTLTIKDKGVGLGPEELDKLFTMTVQSQPGTENERGTGIGLFITHTFVNLNNGAIHITSKKGEGSTVKICLPAFP